jgi:hypothetical protein
MYESHYYKTKKVNNSQTLSKQSVYSFSQDTEDYC